jgi:hypothetical protein
MSEPMSLFDFPDDESSADNHEARFADRMLAPTLNEFVGQPTPDASVALAQRLRPAAVPKTV